MCYIMVIKSRTMRCLGHIARMGEMINVYGILDRNSEYRNPFVNIGM